MAWVHLRAVAPSLEGQAMAGPVLSSKTKFLKSKLSILRDFQTWGGLTKFAMLSDWSPYSEWVATFCLVNTIAVKWTIIFCAARRPSYNDVCIKL